MRNGILLLLSLGLLIGGCSSEGRLVTKVNGPHKVMAKWSLKVYGLSGGAPDEYQIQVWENENVFRAHVKSAIPSIDGVSEEQCDLLCDGKSLWQFNGDDGNVVFEPADKELLRSFYFWRVPSVAYTTGPSEKILGRDCTLLKTSQQDITRNNIDISCWVDPTLGYLIKRENTSVGEKVGGQSQCLEIQAYPTFPAGHFDPPKDATKVVNPPKLWGIGVKI